MINIKSNTINRNVRVLYQIKRTGGRGGSLQIQWQLQCSGYMLAYCVFNASSTAVSLKQPLIVKFLKNMRLCCAHTSHEAQCYIMAVSSLT